jgi:hypothetical protein
MRKFDGAHPSTATLALLGGGDLPLLEVLRTRWHVHSCEPCRREFEALRATRQELRDGTVEDAASPDGLWSGLEAEMRANIRLGLAAGSLASRHERASVALVAPAPWRWAAACGALAFVLVAGWSLRTPERQPGALLPESALAQQSAPQPKLQLLVPVTDTARTETDFSGSTRSRVIDGETGQVTLQQVYVE